MKKIAIVVSHPIQHFCPQYASFAQNKNCSVKVFFGSALGLKKYYDPDFKEIISWGNLELDKFDNVFLNGDAIIQADKHLDAVSLDKELSIFNPDIIIWYGYFQKLQRRALQWAIKKKVIIAYISDSELRHKRSFLKDLFQSIFLPRYFSKVSYFLSVGNANEAVYIKNGVSVGRIIRMHFPIDIKYYQKSYLQKQWLRSKIRKQYGIQNHEIVLLVVGKLSPWKNQDHLIDAMKLLEEQGIYLNLFILGSGVMKESWEQKARQIKISKVYFTGFVNIEELPSFYSASDIYVHPASIEPHSIAISEAIYMGCPIIISDTCGSYGETDDVQEGKNGFVYPFGNIPELVEKLKKLITNQALREEFGKYSHQIAVEFQNNSHHLILDKLLDKTKSIE